MYKMRDSGAWSLNITGCMMDWVTLVKSVLLIKKSLNGKKREMIWCSGEN